MCEFPKKMNGVGYRSSKLKRHGSKIVDCCFHYCYMLIMETTEKKCDVL